MQLVGQRSKDPISATSPTLKCISAGRKSKILGFIVSYISIAIICDDMDLWYLCVRDVDSAPDTNCLSLY